jgi:hypothetical protein
MHRGVPGGTSCVGTVCLKPQRPTAMAGETCDPVGTFCLGATVCTGWGGEGLTCRTPCRDDSDCGAPGDCIAAQLGVTLCRPTAGPGQACQAAMTRCTGGTTCTGFLGQPLTCERPCQIDSECPGGGTCIAAQGGQKLCRPTAGEGEACVPQLTLCRGQTDCSGAFGEELTCRATCARNEDCSANQHCVEGQQALKVCVVKPITIAKLGEASGPAFGCSAAGAQWALAMLAWVGLPHVLARRSRHFSRAK